MSRKRISAILIFLSLVSVCFLVWRLLSFDQRTKIASTVLIHKDGNMDTEAIAAALSARFPVGTPAAEITQLATALDGLCDYESSESIAACSRAYVDRPSGCQIKDKLSCTITTAATICVATKLGLEVKIVGDKTASQIQARKWSPSC